MLCTLNRGVWEMPLVMAVATYQLAFAKLVFQACLVSSIDQQVRNINLLIVVNVVKVQAGQISIIGAIGAFSTKLQYRPCFNCPSSFNAPSANTFATCSGNRLSAVPFHVDLKTCCRQRTHTTQTGKKGRQIDSLPGVWSLSGMAKRQALQAATTLYKTAPFSIDGNTRRNLPFTCNARMRLWWSQAQRFQRFAFQAVTTRRINVMRFAVNNHVPGDAFTAGSARIRHPSNVTNAYDMRTDAFSGAPYQEVSKIS